MIRRIDPTTKSKTESPFRVDVENGFVYHRETGWCLGLSYEQTEDRLFFALSPPDRDGDSLEPSELASRSALRKAILAKFGYFVDAPEMDLLFGYRDGKRIVPGILGEMTNLAREVMPPCT